jgi:hypothetical protein
VEVFFEKVLLKLSSDVKFSQSLNWYEGDSNSTTSLVCTANMAFYITFGVGGIGAYAFRD